MSEEKIKCPICGTANDESSENCKMCKTLLSKKEDGSLKVASPKKSGQTFNMIDIEDPITRKRLEELTLIPGVDRKKALFLYRSGIHSMEEFLQKAFHGERYSDNYARTVSNKLLMQSLKGEDEEQELLCPSCQAPNPINASKCKVCNFEIEKEMAAIDLGNVSESFSEILDELDDDADFDALPEELKAQFASVIDSDDVDYDMEAPEDLDNLGIDLDKIDEEEEEVPEPTEVDSVEADEEDDPTPEEEEVAPEEEAPAEETSTDDSPVEDVSMEEGSIEDVSTEEGSIEDVSTEEGSVENEPEPEDVEEPEPEEIPEEATSTEVDSVEAEEEIAEPEPVEEVEETSTEEEVISEEKIPEKKLSAKEEKVRKVLSGKVDQWRKAGYDIEGLDDYYTDVEGFKVEAKKVLENGKVIQKKYEKQMEMWREKGFDVSELEPLLKSDLDAFQDKVKEVLKKQKK